MLDALLALQRTHNVREVGGRWALEKSAETGTAAGVMAFTSRADGTYVFGAMGALSHPG